MMATLRALALALAAACLAPCQAAPQAMPKGAMLWVYRCDDNATSWTELVKYLGAVAKPAGVTSVSLCAYRVKADGSFGYQTTPYGPSDCGLNQEKHIAEVATTGLKQYPLIDCHAGIDSMRLMMNTTAKRSAFIAAAVAKMKAHKFDGYNLDVELGGTAADALFYTKFVSEFADALHKEGGLLSSDIGGQCGGPDYIGMTCADYKGTPIDMVATMSTYTHTLDSFKKDIAAATAGLGTEIYSVGVDTGSPPAPYFAHLAASKVEKISLWACGHAPCFPDNFTSAMKGWYSGLQ